MNLWNPDTNVVSRSFVFGPDLKMGSFNVIEEDVAVGSNVQVGNHVVLKKGTRIGDNCYIDSGVISSGENWIGDNVTVRFRSIVCRGVKICNSVFISPNVMTIYSAPDGTKVPGIVIEEGAFIGANCVLGAGILVAAYVVLAPCSFARKSLEIPAALYNGNPAKLIKKNYVKVKEAADALS